DRDRDGQRADRRVRRDGAHERPPLRLPRPRGFGVARAGARPRARIRARAQRGIGSRRPAHPLPPRAAGGRA
ncbi:MAG: hypothetical protein AVDCRST_MAG40-3170, partial [uncultured Gemmatimonadaceae bacterium]